MSNSWRISTVNGALLALYFIPVWIFVAFKVVASLTAFRPALLAKMPLGPAFNRPLAAGCFR